MVSCHHSPASPPSLADANLNFETLTYVHPNPLTTFDLNHTNIV